MNTSLKQSRKRCVRFLDVTLYGHSLICVINVITEVDLYNLVLLSVYSKYNLLLFLLLH